MKRTFFFFFREIETERGTGDRDEMDDVQECMSTLAVLLAVAGRAENVLCRGRPEAAKTATVMQSFCPVIFRQQRHPEVATDCSRDTPHVSGQACVSFCLSVFAK